MEQSDLNGDVLRAAESVDRIPKSRTRSETGARHTEAERRASAISMRLAGFTEKDIGDKLGISQQGVSDLLARVFTRVENRAVEQMRAEENARLDRLQLAIWPQAIQGDHQAIKTVLSISRHRAQINGMNAPTKVDVSLSVKAEMEQALQDLENVVLEGEVVEDERDNSELEQ